jgi:hypothetical protein
MRDTAKTPVAVASKPDVSKPRHNDYEAPRLEELGSIAEMTFSASVDLSIG